MPMNNPTLTICNASAGSGKTFTLAAYYVACLLEQPGLGGYRSVLAVTFTNKATAEMKDRILTHLYALGNNFPDPHFLKKVHEVLANRGITLNENDIRNRSALLFNDMLAHYDDIRMTTIDAFLQVLLVGLAQSIGLSANFAVELDTDHLVTTSVDQLLSTHIDEQSGLADTISGYLTQRLDDEENWDIRQSLCDLARELFKETVQEQTTDSDFERDRIRAFKEAARWDKTDAAEELQRVYNDVKQRWNTILPDKGVARYNGFMARVEKMLRGKKVENKDGGLSVQELNRLKDGNPLLRLNELFEQEKPRYMCWYSTTEHLSDMMLLAYLRNRIRANLTDANSVLLSETANKLARALQPGDADFILEKAGIRFRHILLDEFQDTSTLQWRNFRPLIAEILAGGGTTLIVGDTKQSIYRWRNGNRHIMDELDDTFRGFTGHSPLRRNFRSRSEIVRFNLRLFRSLPGMVQPASGMPITLYEEGFNEENLSDYYLPGKHDGGFVSFRAYPYNSKESGSHVQAREAVVRDMFARMEDLLRRGVPAKDMLILIRQGSDATPVITLFRQLRQDMTAFPLLSHCDIVSADSFSLDSSRSVCVAVSGLKYILRRDSVAEAYISYCQPNTDFEALKAVKQNLPLTEMLDEVIRICLCPNGKFDGEDILYLDSLQDKVRDYVGRYGANVEQFLTYWNDRLHSDTIGAAETSAISLMTVHKAKGLEAKNVFIPFCNWAMIKTPRGNTASLLWCKPAVSYVPDQQRLSLVPVSKNKSMQTAGYADLYNAEHDEEQIDNLNLLYVALTRAAERLFISADLPANAAETDHRADSVGSLLLHACGLADGFNETSSMPYVEYTSGEDIVLPADTHEAPQLPRPFSFDNAEPIDATYHLEPTRVEFRQSQDSFQYTMYGTAQGQANLDHRAFGNICHDIMARVARQEEVPQIIDLFVRQGIIRDEVVRAQIAATINRAWQHQKMCDWFSGRYSLLREDTILLPERLRRQFTAEEHSLNRSAEEVTEQRPDRVMVMGDTAIVLDYKFGAMYERVYLPQVRRYMLLMRELGYSCVEGYIWAAENNELIHVEP